MQSLRARTQRTILALTGLALVAATAAWLPAGTDALQATLPQSPHLELTCQMDLCVVEASYVLPVRQDNHEVAFQWETRPAGGYPDNEPDVFRRSLPSGIGEQEADGSGYRYSLADVVWHSDIRCDYAVTVSMSGNLIAPSSVNTDKPVPDSPDGAFCSAYGLAG